jgi:hypothetical protein
LAEFDGLGRGPHRGDLRNLIANDSLTLGAKSGFGRLDTCDGGNEIVFWTKRAGREISAFASN